MAQRPDAVGLFWQDHPTDKKKGGGASAKPKSQPPEPFWLDPGYLPPADQLLLDKPLPLGDARLAGGTEPLVFDVESYPNLFIAVFLGLASRRVWMYAHGHGNPSKLRWVVENRRLISFAGIQYDLPMVSAAACSPYGTEELWRMSMQIVQGTSRHRLLRQAGCGQLAANMVDINDVAPLFGSLKVYAGRLHCPLIQDLPFPPETVLTEQQAAVTMLYCMNDCACTADLYNALAKGMELRRSMTREYGIDLRSRSDAQVAERVLEHELSSRGASFTRTSPPQVHRFRNPACLRFDTPELRQLHKEVVDAEFPLNAQGRVGPAEAIAGRVVTVAGKGYQLGIGGLHSQETSTTWLVDEGHEMAHVDVTSYYPSIVLTQGLHPAAVDAALFLDTYASLVQRRVEAKRAGEKQIADALKISINGVFGKQGSPHSIFYTPGNVMQITVSGQLYLLMLIERLEAAGAEVLSGNTDGLMIRYPMAAKGAAVDAVRRWEADTGMTIEWEMLRSLHSRDVNNYVAVEADGSTFAKGVFGKAGLTKNPANWILYKAAIDYVAKGSTPEDTVLAHTGVGAPDIRPFLTLRTVKGGAVKGDRYLGGVVRWYRSTDNEGDILYASNGNRVPMTSWAQPCMALPPHFPANVDVDWYASEALEVLRSVGVPVADRGHGGEAATG